jgi:hypothetical protein
MFTVTDQLSPSRAEEITALPRPDAQYSLSWVPTVAVAACVPNEVSALPERRSGAQRLSALPTSATSTSAPTVRLMVRPLSSAFRLAFAGG